MRGFGRALHNTPCAARVAAALLTAWLATSAQAAPPVLETLEPLVLPRGETSSITPDVLEVVDPDTPPGQIVYRIVSIPSHGVLWGAAPYGVGDDFTQDHVDFGQVWYSHDGGPHRHDSFVFTVSDMAGGSIGATVFDIEISGPMPVPALGAPAKLSLVAALTLAAWLTAARRRQTSKGDLAA